MKKIKILLAFFICNAIISSAFAYSISDVHFSISPVYELQNGYLNEFVYMKDSKKELYKLSEINWQLKNLSVLGFQSAIGYKNIELESNFKYAFPKSSGITHDSDWLNENDHTMKTTYSKSENTDNMTVFFKAKAAYNFDIINKLSVKPFLGFEFYYYDFSARNAEGWYGSNCSYDDANATHYLPGALAGIDYTRYSFDGIIGATLNYNPIYDLNINLSLSASPYTYTYSYDTHYADYECETPGNCYLDKMSGLFKQYCAELNLYYTIAQHFDVGIKADYNHLFQMQGLSKRTGITGIASSRDETKFVKAQSVPRCSGYWWDAGIYLKIKY